MIDFKEEVLKHKDEMLKDLKDLCLIPSTLDKSTAKKKISHLVKITVKRLI